MGGTHRISVDTLGRDFLPVASLQSLIDAHNQRISFGDEYLHEQAQQDAAHFSTRPLSVAQDPVVAVESLLLV
jgi:hypothetical protein